MNKTQETAQNQRQRARQRVTPAHAQPGARATPWLHLQLYTEAVQLYTTTRLPHAQREHLSTQGMAAATRVYISPS